MSCRKTGPLLLEQELGRLSPARATELEDHLASCAACAAEARRERRLSDALAGLRQTDSCTVDVRQRVLASVSSLRPEPFEPVPAAQLGWATAFASGLGLSILALLFTRRLELATLAGEALSLARSGLHVADGLWRPFIAVVGVIFGLLLQLFTLISKLGPHLSPLSTFGTAAAAAAYLFMSLTIFFSVRRDFRPASRSASRKEH